jgi:hypothetical protein
MAGRPRLGIVVALVLAFTPGCGKRPTFYPAQGKLFVDGKPAEGALVVLHPVNDAGPLSIRPSGKVGPDGTFTLNSYIAETRTTNLGAPAGEYLVTVTWLPPDVRDYLEKHQGGELPDRLQGKYANATSSPLPHLVVLEGPTDLAPIELKTSR